jgi:pimeloyl-ACP methyl ester carboxylesterase
MPTAKINGVGLYYEIHGKGEPLLLIAGLASDSQSWLPILDELSRYYRVITFDNRGVGRTKPQDMEMSIPLMADDSIALLKHLGLSKVHFLGHSMGGFIALECAIRYPEYISKLILASTSVFNTERNKALFNDWVSYLENGMKQELWFRNFFYWILTKRFFENGDVLNDAIRLSIEYPYQQTAQAFRNQVHAINEYNCLEALPGIQSKTMVICGKEDLLFTPEEIAAVLPAIPGAQFSFIDHAAHAVFMEKPGEFVKTVAFFLGNG